MARLVLVIVLHLSKQSCPSELLKIVNFILNFYIFYVFSPNLYDFLKFALDFNSQVHHWTYMSIKTISLPIKHKIWIGDVTTKWFTQSLMNYDDRWQLTNKVSSVPKTHLIYIYHGKEKKQKLFLRVGIHYKSQALWIREPFYIMKRERGKGSLFDPFETTKG